MRSGESRIVSLGGQTLDLALYSARPIVCHMAAAASAVQTRVIGARVRKIGKRGWFENGNKETYAIYTRSRSIVTFQTESSNIDLHQSGLYVIY